MVSRVLKCAVVGTGVIGRGWMYVFSRAGCPTRICDAEPLQTQKALAWFEATLKEDVKDGFITAPDAENCRALISAFNDLEVALEGADYVQEAGPESLTAKNAIFLEVDRVADPTAIIASSTSSLDINAITRDVKGLDRCITAHPFNPPHIIPVVEVLPAEKTGPEVTQRTVDFLSSVGQKPVLMNRFVVGYLINRIQAAVVREAIHLVTSGAASVEAVDTLMSDGLGLRWALFGSFGINHTNADGGIREYYTRYGHAYQSIMNDLDSKPPLFDPEMIELIARGVEDMLEKTPVADHCRWRDRLVLKIRRLKDEDPRP